MFSDDELNQFYRYCIALTGDESTSYELVQASLEKFVRRGEENIRNVKSYFVRIIRNQFLDDLRMDRKHQTEELFDDEKVIQLASRSLEDITVDREQAEKILSLLEAQDREVLFLWAVEGWTLQEIADHLEIPKGTLLSRIHRFRSKIKEILEIEKGKVIRS